MYEPGADRRLSAGFNGAQQPVRAGHLTPLTVAIPERHFAIAISLGISRSW